MSAAVSAVILAAGLGTRMRSKRAKVLHRAGGLALVEHVIRAARGVANAADIVVVVGHQAEQVRAVTSSWGVRFAEQRELRGTGYGVEMARELLAEDAGCVAILNGDCPLLRVETLEELVRRQKSSAAAGTVITTTLDDPSGYGRIVRDASGHVAAIVEQKAATPEQSAIREINSGIYCFQADLLWGTIGELKPNPASGEIYLTDIVEALGARGHKIAPMAIEDSSELMGINTRVDLAQVDRLFRDRKARQLMLDGVTIEKPETVTVDADVQVGADSVIEPFVRLTGSTVIGEDCRIGQGAVIADSILEDGVEVAPYTFIGASRVGAGAKLGPFARLRRGNEVAPGARVGNFVELKNTRLGAGSKAMHLAYLGDSTIGKKVNVGAGTITCNYDGERKSQTQIGDGVFVGSNSTLVAPVEIGAESYIAAGSVITDAVPPDTLALGRARQVLKQGWPGRRRAKR